MGGNWVFGRGFWYGLTLTGATPGRNKRTNAGNIRCKCSSTALPKASSACSTWGGIGGDRLVIGW